MHPNIPVWFYIATFVGGGSFFLIVAKLILYLPEICPWPRLWQLR